MPKVHVIEFSGKEHVLDAQIGDSLMHCVVSNGVPGIEAECGGCCSCGTCHCYVDPSWVATVGPADDMESQMLETVPEPGPTSRLSCQITLGEQHEGLIVRLPESQY